MLLAAFLVMDGFRARGYVPPLERLSRYETALWRQVAQLLFVLNYLHRPLRRQFSRTRKEPLLLGSRRE
jgi:hypothetical protein